MVEIIGINASIGILPGAPYGAVTGGVIGIFSSIVSGGDPAKGGLLGAVTGGILGGVIGGIEAQQLGGNLWIGYRVSQGMLIESVSSLEGLTPVSNSIDEVKNVYNENFKDLVKADITFYKIKEGANAGSLDGLGFKGYNVDAIGNITGPKGKVLGVTRSSIWKHGDNYKILFASGAFSSKEQLSYVLVHELGHVNISKAGLSSIASQKIVQGAHKLIDNVGHQAIQKMTYKFLQTNGWLNLNIIGQATKEVLDNWMLPDVNGTVYNAIKMLGNVKIK
ncbi:hypothetical protein Ga0061079_105129 [Apibacter mensalis]|uniref:Uncharacterized protein n=1 Tax=Apibacter mensalis TaxID=1586267 RepID=A0A0X3AP60_9FLAO|nr:hypothetical protein [Apibacter mensalis]CVK16170.1 hypothetical protein Ga0061079_105129 [Apibacter mensalis]